MNYMASTYREGNKEFSSTNSHVASNNQGKNRKYNYIYISIKQTIKFPDVYLTQFIRAGLMVFYHSASKGGVGGNSPNFSVRGVS